jgi:hypothetical protein
MKELYPSYHLLLSSAKVAEALIAYAKAKQASSVAVGKEGNISFIPPPLQFPENARRTC